MMRIPTAAAALLGALSYPRWLSHRGFAGRKFLATIADQDHCSNITGQGFACRRRWLRDR